MDRQIITIFLFASLLYLPFSVGTYRYYNSYITYGTGDTIIQTYHLHGGPLQPLRKWNVECMDGEAMIGINDFWEDFERIQIVWCKFTFPFKPPSNGVYPYYPTCHTRNLTDQWHCYDPQNSTATVNTFVTALSSTHFFFFTFRVPGPDAVQPYKCCKTPSGYYIDYVSCYYMPTHDLDWEYYDSERYLLVFCAEGYVMTGVSKKLNPYALEYRMEWIQCCRVGYGRPYNVQPPVVYADSGAAAYHAPPDSAPPISVPPGFSGQYRSLDNKWDKSRMRSFLDSDRSNTIADKKTLKKKDALARPELFGALPPHARSEPYNKFMR